ncbi:MAG: hypothetical protein AABY41_06445 [Nitrospirota bacterium]
MGTATDIKRLGEDIVSSYDMRVKAIGELVKDTHNMLKGFHVGHKEMANKLTAFLAKGEKDRLKDFKEMMGDVKKFVVEMIEGTAKLMKEIQKEQKDRNQEVAALLEKFEKDHEFMADELRKGIAEGEIGRLQDFKTMTGDIQKYVTDVVRETERLIKEIQARQTERKEDVLERLQEFKAEREQMAASWQKLSATMYRRRGGKVSVEAAEEVKSVEEIVRSKKNKEAAKNRLKRGL